MLNGYINRYYKNNLMYGYKRRFWLNTFNYDVVGDPKETRTPMTWMKTMDPNR